MNTKKLNIVFLPAILSLLMACNKLDVPEPVEEVPIFYTDLSAGDNNLNISAGKDNYLMETNFRVSASEKALDLIGLLRPSDCVSRDCPGSIRISIRHHVPYEPARFNVNNTLEQKSYQFAWSASRDSATIAFDANVNVNEATVITWKFADEKELRNTPAFHREIKYGKDYLVKLDVNRQSCKSSQLQTINLPNGGCRSVLVPDGRRLGVRSDGVPPFKYLWSTGVTDSIFMLEDASSTNLKEIKVRVTDSRNCISEASMGYRMAMANDGVCRTDFAYKSQPLQNRDKIQFGKVLVEMINRDGTKFQSDLFQQPAAAYFEVLEVSDFQVNERGQKTKKLKIRLSLLLFNHSAVSDGLKLEGSCTIAVAYPD